MLVKYKKAFEKIAMGLISLMAQEKDVKRLMKTMQRYEEKENWTLYLWKQDDEYIGVIGLKEKKDVAVIQHIAVIPSYLSEGVAQQMFDALCELGQFETIQANEATEPFLQKYVSIKCEVEDTR